MTQLTRQDGTKIQEKAEFGAGIVSQDYCEVPVDQIALFLYLLPSGWVVSRFASVVPKSVMPYSQHSQDLFKVRFE